MTLRIAVESNVDDARAKSYLHHLKAVFPQSGLKAAFVVQAYTVDANLSPEELKRAAERLTNPITETYSTDVIPAPESFACAIEVGYLAGVTDNVGHTAKQTIEDCLGRKFTDEENVYSSIFFFFQGEMQDADIVRIAGELHNPLIQGAIVYKADQKEFPVYVPRMELHGSVAVDEVELNVSDDELKKLSKEGIQARGPLSLTLSAMKAIRDHFNTLGRKPTDVELETVAASWSEHCKHTIFADPLDEIKEGIYRRYIKGATEKIRKAKGKKDFCVSVFKDNAGAISFDKDYLVTHKVETHNSPSGLDPFGGSVTAIVGVNRDSLGFGLGSKPIANTYGFCVADPNDAKELFRDGERTKPLLSARRILEGVIAGINAGGNQSGIPTPLGFVAVDENFRGKPLVFGGTVGLIPRRLPRSDLGRLSYEKRANAGDYIVMIGGRVGLDGIHGATFSSVELSKGSPATAVQIGDPITQKKFSDALVREARDAGLYSSITDDGAGGLSGSVTEMARESGGCNVDLDKVPLKYNGLSPWQIWLSESQERMTLAVPKQNWDALKKIFDRHEVEASIIGTFTDSGKAVLRYADKIVMELDMDFLHDGRPAEKQKSKKPKRSLQEPATERPELSETLLKMLARPSIGSTSFIAQQYDHEVQGTSVTKPLEGKGRVNNDAAVMQPLPHSKKGIVLSHGYCPWYSEIDTYAMAAAAIDTAVRNAVCAGASREYLAILDNFCWSSSEKPERLYELKESARACYETAVAYKTPFISGKDSMFNDFRGFDAGGNNVHIAALPTLLVSTLGVITDVAKAVTLDFKRVGDLVYLIGETNDELGASEYFEMLGAGGKRVPIVDTKKNAKAYDALTKAIGKGFIVSALGVGRGGLAIALAKSAIAGQLGAQIDLSKIRGNAKKPDTILFSESQGRMLVSISRANQKKFERLFRGTSLQQIGEIVQAPSVSIQVGEQHSDISLYDLTNAYRSFFKEW